MVRPRAIRLEGDFARMGSRYMHRVLWLGNLRQRDNLEDLGVDRIILK